MKKLFRLFCRMILVLAMIAGSGSLAPTQAEREGRYAPRHYEDKGRDYPAPRGYRERPKYDRPRWDNDHVRDRGSHQRYHRSYEHCARHFPERSSRFDRCLNYERNPGLFHGW